MYKLTLILLNKDYSLLRAIYNNIQCWDKIRGSITEIYF